MTKEDVARGSAQGTSGETLDAEAERLLRDIEGTSSFVLRTTDPEDLDPSEVGEPGVPGAQQAHDAFDPSVPEGFEEETHLDEPAFHIATDAQRALEEQQEQERVEEVAAQRRHRLRNTLVVVIFILLILAAGIGAFVLNAPNGQDSKQSGTQTMAADGNATDETSFQPVDPQLLPRLAELFGSNLEDVEAATRGTLAVSNDVTETSQAAVESMRYEVAASMSSVSGEPVANAMLGLDEEKRLVYVRCTYDLDALKVADADFRTLAADGTVAASLLTGMGVDAVYAPPSALKVKDGTVDSSGDHESCSFSGQTGRDSAPSAWNLTENYDHSAGKAQGDNHVIRTMTVELQ